jgi:hypothetical protein
MHTPMQKLVVGVTVVLTYIGIAYSQAPQMPPEMAQGLQQGNQLIATLSQQQAQANQECSTTKAPIACQRAQQIQQRIVQIQQHQQACQQYNLASCKQLSTMR